MGEEFIKVSSDDFIPIKATPQETTPLMKKKIQERVDSLNAKKRHEQKPAQYNSMANYLRDKVRRKNIVPGGVVVGDLSAEEQDALRSGDERILRRQALLRQRAMKIMKERRLEGKTQRDYFQGYRGYEELAKRQGRLPNAPQEVKDRSKFLKGE